MKKNTSLSKEEKREKNNGTKEIERSRSGKVTNPDNLGES